MRTIYIAILLLFSTLFSNAQEYNQQVQDIIDNVSIDSLIYQLRNISGEDSVFVEGEKTIIEHRVNSLGNDLAAAYIFESLEKYGLEPYYDDFYGDGRNVIAVQEGTMYPEEYYMICAHYDAVDYYCADDNGSGTAGVIEAARIFTGLEFEYSIIYALFDREEAGLIGSSQYAAAAASNGDEILGVINMDMIAWDNDEDMVAEIHSSFSANSNQLSDYLMDINEAYELLLTPSVKIPGTGASDHASFWSNGYPAVLLIEEYWGGDFNPYYHTENDRIDILNMPYFHEMAKLAIGSLASLGSPMVESSIDLSNAMNGSYLRNHPNPFSTETVVTFSTDRDAYIRLVVYNAQGKEVGVLHDGDTEQGEHSLSFTAGHLPEGLYFLSLQSTDGMMTHKIVVQ
jgi:hypothetical protein